MEIFGPKSQILVDRAFTALDKFSSPSSNIFFNSLPNNSPQGKPFVGFALKATDIPADVSAILRQTSSPTMSALGATTPFNAVSGSCALVESIKAYGKVDDMHDAVGKQLLISDIGLRISQIFAGAGFVLVRFADIANNGFNSFKCLAIPAAYALNISINCFGGLYLGLAILSAISINESNVFLKKVKKAKTEEGFEDLKTLIGDLTGRGHIDSDKKMSEKDVHVHLGLELRSMLNEIDPKLARGLSNKKLGKALFNPQYSKFLNPVLSRLGVESKSDLTTSGLALNKDLIRVVSTREKQVVYNRIIGSKGMNWVKRAQEMNLFGLLSSGNEKDLILGKKISMEVLSEIQKAARTQRHIMSSLLTCGGLGAAFTVVGDLFLSPLFVTIATAGFFACYLIMGYGETLNFWEAYKSGDAFGTYAKPYIALHFCLGLAAIATAIALTIVTGGIFPIACIAIIGAVWLFMDVWMYVLMTQREKQHEIDHPTLQKFLDCVGESDMEMNISKEALEMFHKLPKLQRDAILGSLSKIYTQNLKTFENDSSQALEVYKECQNQEVIAKAFEATNRVLIGTVVDENSLEKHPCKDLFYKNFYNELARFEQEIVIKKAGRTNIRNAIAGLMEPVGVETPPVFGIPIIQSAIPAG